MTIKTYIQRANEICLCFEKKGLCNTKCPLKPFDCGLPKTKSDIPKAIKVVEEFDEKKLEGICGRCGRNNEEQIEREAIAFCPGCGMKIESEEQDNE